MQENNFSNYWRIFEIAAGYYDGENNNFRISLRFCKFVSDN
jgi:hypothetical protein